MTTKYTDDREINPSIPNLNRLKVVGNEGHFDLEISNASLCDQGYYRCSIDSSTEYKIQMISYILQLKSKYFDIHVEYNLFICNEIKRF